MPKNKTTTTPARPPEGSRIHALGRKVTSFQGFDTFPTPKGLEKVTCISDEVTSNCPVTGQPDWYVVEATYVPDQLCVESKTLKLFLQSFRNEGHFCEAFACIIARKLFDKLRPFTMTVTVRQKPRGGVAIHATSTLHRNSLP